MGLTRLLNLYLEILNQVWMPTQFDHTRKQFNIRRTKEYCFVFCNWFSMVQCNVLFLREVWEIGCLTRSWRSLCLHKKLVILMYPNRKQNVNKRSELVSKCRHENKFLLPTFNSNDWRNKRFLFQHKNIYIYINEFKN